MEACMQCQRLSTPAVTNKSTPTERRRRRWTMPRPCQKRRESAAAQRRSKPNPKPSGPPPIRHKARQKAIHNARRGRGGARGGAGRGGRGGRGGGSGRGGGGGGGRPTQNQRSDHGIDANQDFISFASSGNNFHLLHGAGSRQNPIALLGEDDFLEDGEVTDSGSEEHGSDDSDMYDAEALTINVDVDQIYGERPKRATVMFPVHEAIAIYRKLHDAGFPLLRTTVGRYGVQGYSTTSVVEARQQTPSLALPQYSRVSFKADAVVASSQVPAYEPCLTSSSSSHVSPASTYMSRQPSTSTATSGTSAGTTRPSNAARDYRFDWGVHSGKHFLQIPENYLRMIAGDPILIDQHPGIKDAFDYHRPGMRRTVPTKKQLASQPGELVQATSRGRIQGNLAKAKGSWESFRFPSGAHEKKRITCAPLRVWRTW
jgi:hypothetical protein